MQECLIELSEVSELKCHEVAFRVRKADAYFSWRAGGTYKQPRGPGKLWNFSPCEGLRVTVITYNYAKATYLLSDSCHPLTHEHL